MNNSVNNNFLEEEVEYEEVPESEITEADEVLEEIEGEIEEEQRQVEEAMATMSEVEKRIEQANLYKAVLNSQLFAPNSARPEIIRTVDREFKEFVLFRLEVLLGIKGEGQRPGQQAPQSLFTEEEATALKALVQRLIAKGQPAAPVQPQVQQVQPVQARVTQVQTRQQAAPAIQPVQATTQLPQASQQVPAPQGQKMVKRVVSRKVNGQPVQAQPKVSKPSTRRQKSNNVATLTGEDLSQVVNPALPPKKMPSQATMDMMNAQQAERNARGSSTGDAMSGGMLNTALTQIMSKG